MTRPPLTPLNWRTSPEFLHFLRFEFDFHMASPEARHQVITLLPLAVGDDRMYGAIANAVLKEALALWNKEPQHHLFALGPNTRWRYLGTMDRPGNFAHDHDIALMFGRLKRPLTPGSFCRRPSIEVMA